MVAVPPGHGPVRVPDPDLRLAPERDQRHRDRGRLRADLDRRARPQPGDVAEDPVARLRPEVVVDHLDDPGGALRVHLGPGPQGGDPLPVPGDGTHRRHHSREQPTDGEQDQVEAPVRLGPHEQRTNLGTSHDRGHHVTQPIRDHRPTRSGKVTARRRFPPRLGRTPKFGSWHAGSRLVTAANRPHGRPATPRPLHGTGRPQMQGQRPRAFLVDDNDGLRVAIRELLTDAGVEVVGEARDSGTALLAISPAATSPRGPHGRPPARPAGRDRGHPAPARTPRRRPRHHLHRVQRRRHGTAPPWRPAPSWCWSSGAPAETIVIAVRRAWSAAALAS